MNILHSALGHYEVTGNPEQADVIIGHSFGTSIGEHSPNHEIAEFILKNGEGLPIVADRTLVDAFPGRDSDVAVVVEGPITNGVGQGVGSWGTLVEAKRFMNREGLRNALMVGQAHHIGRIAMQAEKLEVTSIIPPGLPAGFDTQSEQRWTRSLGLWIPREVLGSVVLRLQKRL